MLSCITQWITKILGMNSDEDPPGIRPVKVQTTGTSEIKTETIKQLLENVGFSTSQINDYFLKMSCPTFKQNVPVKLCNDPRGLPRLRKHGQRLYTGKGEEIVLPCTCHNCVKIISHLSECAICLEPISSKMITSCIECGNIACTSCASKMFKCPFCRSSLGLVKNLALQRLVNELLLPCSILKGNEHVLCLHKKCIWTGSINNLAHHLAESHTCIVFEGSFVTLVISEFKSKTKSTTIKPRSYCLVLTNSVHVYVCKIILTGVKLEFIVLGVSKTELNNFGLTVEVSCKERAIKGVIPFSKKRAYVSLCTQSLLFMCRKKSDSLKISLAAQSLS